MVDVGGNDRAAFGDFLADEFGGDELGKVGTEMFTMLCAFMRGDTQAAELWSRMSDLDYNPMHRLVLLAILGTLGKKDEAATQLTWLKTRSPALIPNVRREIGRRLARPEDQERFFAGLAAAGLPLDDRQVTEK